MFYQPSNNELWEVSRAHSREEVIVIEMGAKQYHGKVNEVWNGSYYSDKRGSWFLNGVYL